MPLKELSLSGTLVSCINESCTMRSTTDRVEDVDRRPHGRPQAIVHYLIAHAPASFQQKHLGIAQILVAAHQHLVARL